MKGAKGRLWVVNEHRGRGGDQEHGAPVHARPKCWAATCRAVVEASSRVDIGAVPPVTTTTRSLRFTVCDEYPDIPGRQTGPLGIAVCLGGYPLLAERTMSGHDAGA